MKRFLVFCIACTMGASDVRPQSVELPNAFDSLSISELETIIETLDGTIEEKALSIKNVHGQPMVFFDVFTAIQEGSKGELIDTDGAGLMKKTVALPVNLIGKLISGTVGGLKGVTQYGKEKPWRTLFTTILLADSADGDVDLFGVFASDPEPSNAQRDSTAFRKITAGNGSTVTIQSDRVASTDIVVGNDSEVFIKEDYPSDQPSIE